MPVLRSNPRFSHYFNDESKEQLTGELLKESRLVIWKSSINIVRNNFVFGVGTGDIQDELNKEYQLEGVKVLAIANNLNTHNQFLEVLVENGFIGILLFLWLFGIMFYLSLKEANIIYLMFIMIAFISFFFETMLNRLAGVSFFPLFSFLLIYRDKKNLVNITDFNERID
jgi:O-antigen ligase